MLTFEQIKELIELVGAQRLQGLEVERSGFRLKIDGQGAAPTATAAQPTSAAAAPPVTATAPVAAALAPQAPAAPAPPAAAPADAGDGEADVPAGATVVESPIVGTFYRSPSPDQAPYVEVGDTVKKGQVLCIVEAMKLMNEIESDVAGEVVEIYRQNAQPVEFGEKLFAIKPS